MTANATVLPANITAVHYTILDDQEYPPARAWFEASAVGHSVERVIGFEDLLALEPTAACGACVDDWLRQNGVDTSYTPEERRFIQLKDRLHELLRPRFEPALERIVKMVLSRTHQPTAMGFPGLRGRPFAALAGNRNAGHVRIEVHDDGASLVGSFSDSIFNVGVRAEIERSERIALVDDALDERATTALVSWADDVERLLNERYRALQSS